MKWQVTTRMPTLSLIDLNRKVFESLDAKQLPPISLWGLHRCLFSGKVLNPPLIPGLSDGRSLSCKQELAELLFHGTPLDLFAGETPFFPPRERFEKSAQNRMTWTWYHYWRLPRDPSAPQKVYYPEPLKRLEQAYLADPVNALDGVSRNISALTRGCTNYAQLSSLSQQLLEQVYPDRAQEGPLGSPEQRLALLAVRALLSLRVGGGGTDPVWAWLSGRDPKTASTPYAPFFPSGHARRFPIPTSVFSPGSGIYSLPDDQIDAALLPELVCRERRCRYDRAQGSPLLQILRNHSDSRRFLLCGQPDPASGGTTVSGAGKTTTLRYLCFEAPDDWTVLFLPLADVYSARALASPHNLTDYIRRHYHLDLDLPAHRLYLLMDGLDELVGADGLERLCGDLEELSFRDDISIVVSSKQPLEQLPGFETLSRWNLMWQDFLPCWVQPMTHRQRGGGTSPQGELLDILSTPFLLSLYRTTAKCSDSPRARTLLRRWGVEKLFQDGPKNAAELFYCSLIAQLVRWFEANKGQERQSEVDAFLLLHTLPAIAFQMLLREMCEGRLHPAVQAELGQNDVSRMIRLSWAGTRAGLSLFPGYRNQGQPMPVSLTLQRELDYDHFLSGQVPTLFRVNWVPGDTPAEPWREEYRFSNHSLRDYLASLHIANVFRLAQAGLLSEDEALIPFYGCTLEFLVKEPILRAVDFLCLLLPEGTALEHLLEDPTKQASHPPLSRFLAGQIGARMREQLPACSTQGPDKAGPWYEALIQAYLSSVMLRPFAGRYYKLTYIFAENAMSRICRQCGRLVAANTAALHVCGMRHIFPDIPNSDGPHLQAMIWWKILSTAYNLFSPAEAPAVDPTLLPRETERALFPWLESLHGESCTAVTPVQDMLSSLRRMAAGEHLVSDPVFGTPDARTEALAPIFVEMLERGLNRWSAYRSQRSPGSLAMARLCLLSLRAKACSICSACGPGVSGAALHLLGYMLESQTETFENDSRLPCFQANPGLHLDDLDLAYTDHNISAFQVYRRIYDIRRGIQPYPARKLSELLLRRLVCLDDGGQPAACESDTPFTPAELDFLEQSTARAAASANPGTSYWRARYLHERAWTLGLDTKEGRYFLQQARQALQTDWERCRCTQRLDRDELNMDMNSARIVAETLALGNADDYDKWPHRYARLSAFFQAQAARLDGPQTFQLASRLLEPDFQDCLDRLERFGTAHNENLFRAYFHAPAHS